MKRILNIELKKLIPYSTFWVLIGIHFVLFIIVVLVINSFEIQIPGFEMPKLFEFPLVWNLVCWIASWFNLFLAIIIIAFVGNEYVFKTFRQHLIDGLSRSDLLKGKLMVILLISIYGLFLVLFTSAIFGIITTPDLAFASVFNQSFYVFIYFIQAIAYMTFAFFIILLVKNIALSILFFILYKFPVEPIIRGLLPDEIIRFFPMKVISNLTPLPAQDLFEINTQSQFYGNMNGQNFNMPVNQNIVADLSLTTNTFLALGYITLFIAISYIIIRRKNF
ncbi:MAG: hypothetical protein ABIJ97_06765 [Bacteroidota bacterium]